MYALNISAKKYFQCLILFITVTLSGCAHISEMNLSNKSYYLEGNIQNINQKIPEDATVTLSVTQSKIAGEKEFTFRDYTFLTQSQSKMIPFRLALHNELSSLSHQLSISVRVEKNGKLIMMSDKLTPLTDQPDKKLTLIVHNS